ncbi:MAG: superoxide dismutase [Pseudomonadaceae bacterium]|nr:superoxide dismutase [Pseudomonadaceae bacterium]
MDFTVARLPFEEDALEPFISARTLSYHHGKHHAGYVKKLDRALADERREWPLEKIVAASSGGVFNLAAQVWNHDFYWKSLAPGGGEASKVMVSLIDASFGGMAGFRARFKDAAASEFGSGWAWLVYRPVEQDLAVLSTTDAVTPLTSEAVPLLTLDVWEHAYYLDFFNDRGRYIEEFLDGYLNWSFASDELARALAR